ncbi:restart primosome assembly protein PriC [Pasteurella langaaensis DSM 22999]|uniref:Restart primosome assembly protein PriC n=1 Tax=Alitibacter langaaensis DSM 22999 TaxID=1122935 RepID=A0A2U0SJX2_9PAST|nr:primosomal replication protein PriC [Pasteurella langaaensis]PVX31656.1 restart primosome assembly protein PriC [Pasteurella langaaensis DSM 22999]
MSNHISLLNQLIESVEQLQSRYHSQSEQIIYTKFAPLLFSENYQPTKFYLNELNHTLSQLQQLNKNDIAQFAFFSEKLLAQCTALSEALDKSQFQSSQSAVNFPKVLNTREQRRQEIEQLPPRERLDKYYEALKALNDKLNEQKDQLKQSQDLAAQNSYSDLIKQTRQRRQRCLEAIEVLEEYLAFKDAQE